MLLISYGIVKRYGGDLGIKGTLQWPIVASFATPIGVILLWGGRLSRIGGCLALVVGYIIFMIAVFNIGKHV